LDQRGKQEQETTKLEEIFGQKDEGFRQKEK
jgi:hypothetical protein